MIGFKVIDTVNGEVINADNCFVSDQGTGVVYELRNKLGEFGQIDGTYLGMKPAIMKAVPSITIDGVEYYHGMVIQYTEEEHVNCLVILFNLYKFEYRWENADYNCPFPGMKQLLNYSKTLEEVEMKTVGNVWQPEFSHLKSLLEV